MIVRVVKRIVKGIYWHGKVCVMILTFLSDEHAKAEAALMKDLMHPHIVLLIGYARSKKQTQLLILVAAFTRYSH